MFAVNTTDEVFQDDATFARLTMENLENPDFNTKSYLNGITPDEMNDFYDEGDNDEFDGF